VKRLHLLIFKSFVGPFILIFFIVLFVLLMQFLWRYIDDLVGKGLKFSVIAELLLYTSSSLVPMALPLAILMSSLMTFGNMGEFYELTAIKASGISLQRVMMPLIILVIFISIGAFFFANEVLPYTNLKMRTLLYDVRNQRPEIQILPGSFYSGVDGYSIRVERKNPSTSMLYNIKIYDHTQNRGNISVTIADSGKMVVTEDENELIFTLYSGYSYNELTEERDLRRRKDYPHRYDKFKEERVLIELKGFALTRTDENLFRNHYSMLDLAQLEDMEDSIKADIKERKKLMNRTLVNGNYFRKHTSIVRRPEVKPNLNTRAAYDSILPHAPGYPFATHPGTEYNPMIPSRYIPPGHDTTGTYTKNKYSTEVTVKGIAPAIAKTEKTEGNAPTSHGAISKKTENLLRHKDSLNRIAIRKREEEIRLQESAAAHREHRYEEEIITGPGKGIKETNPDTNLYVNLFQKLTLKEKESVLNNATSYARSARTYVVSSGQTVDAKVKNLRRFEIEWQRKFTIAFACFIFLFIGAPLGAIIRKGGLGLPLVISTLFFIFYYIVSLTGEKVVRESILPAYQGMWISSFVLLLTGVFLTYKATTDAAMLHFETYTALIKKYLGIRTKNIVESLRKGEHRPVTRAIKYDNLLASLSSFRDTISDTIDYVEARMTFEGFLLSLIGLRDSSNILLFERLYKNILLSIINSELSNEKSVQSKLAEFPNFNYQQYLDLRWRLYLRLTLLLVPPITLIILIRHYIQLSSLKSKLNHIDLLIDDLILQFRKNEALNR
jgi:lipopolysaccharide export system permease protein